ncbi:hypothetical protein, partial [Bacteroides rodentium]|uniref:hypothetical protein n=1 Tax=Bacteroides rodentium TaxID=691816 RepID=UPI0021CDA1C2
MRISRDFHIHTGRPDRSHHLQLRPRRPPGQGAVQAGRRRHRDPCRIRLRRLGLHLRLRCLNRLTDAVHGAGRYTEKVTAYDKNGNIRNLQRYGQTSAGTYGMIDN